MPTGTPVSNVEQIKATDKSSPEHVPRIPTYVYIQLSDVRMFKLVFGVGVPRMRTICEARLEGEARPAPSDAFITRSVSFVMRYGIEATACRVYSTKESAGLRSRNSRCFCVHARLSCRIAIARSRALTS